MKSPHIQLIDVHIGERDGDIGAELVDGAGAVQAVGPVRRPAQLGQCRGAEPLRQGDETQFLSVKTMNQVLQLGDAYIFRSGGGDYGSPLERDLTSLERDVRCGYATKEGAEKNYGAAFKPDSLTLDIAATNARPPTSSGWGYRMTNRSARSSSRSPRRRSCRPARPSMRR